MKASMQGTHTLLGAGGHVGRKVANRCLVGSGVCCEVINEIKCSDLD
jgi:hypothetical protein